MRKDLSVFLAAWLVFSQVIGFPVDEVALAIESPPVDVSLYAVTPSSTAAVNTAGIQAAIDAQYAAGGGEVQIATPGIYLLAVAGNDPYYGQGHGYCLDLKSNARLIIGPGVELKLADGEQVDDAPVNIVAFGAADNIYIGGGGRITGNTEGQPGWTTGGDTGDKYGQSCNAGCLVSQFYLAGSSRNITIENLTLDDHFSNPVNLCCGDNGIVMRNLWTDKVGEGFQVIGATDVVWDNLHIADSTASMVGDGSELSAVDGFSVNGLFLTNGNGSQGGSALDTYLSRNGSISNVRIDGWCGGIDMQSNTTHSFNININDVVAKNILCHGAAGGLGIVGDNTYNIYVSNYVVDNSMAGGTYIGRNAHDIVISDSRFDNNFGPGMQVFNVKNLTLSNIVANGNSTSGIQFVVNPGITDNAQLSGILVSGVTAQNNGTWGVEVSNSIYPFHYSGKFSGLDLGSTNGSGPISVGDAEQVKNLSIEFVQSPGTTGSGCSIRPDGKPNGESPLGAMLALLSPWIILLIRRTMRRKNIRRFAVGGPK